MQSDIVSIDVTALNIQLNELRSRFDQVIREGDDFQDLKETYMHMKEIECHLKALQWDPEHQVNRSSNVPAWM